MNYHIKYIKIIKNTATRKDAIKHIQELKAHFKQQRDFVRATKQLKNLIKKEFMLIYKDVKAVIETMARGINIKQLAEALRQGLCQHDNATETFYQIIEMDYTMAGLNETSKFQTYKYQETIEYQVTACKKCKHVTITKIHRPAEHINCCCGTPTDV